MQSDLVLSLHARPGNPRNSEGAFITLADGRIFYAWSRYTGDSWSDHARADIVARTSGDGGRTWSDTDCIVVANEGACNVMSVSLRRLQDGRIGLFYLQKNSLHDCRLRLRFSSDEARTWGEPILCNPTPGYFVTNNDRVLQLANGRLLAASSFHRPMQADGDLDAGLDSHGEVAFFISDDAGQTWCEGPQRLQVPAEITSGLQEPGLIERRDGSLYGWARTTAGRQWEFTSTDGGETWTPPHPSRFQAPCSPMSIKAITPDPRWLAVWNDPLEPVTPETAFANNSSWGRTPLALATSRDEGHTWSSPQLLETDPERGFCYIAIHPVEDAVLLAYCCGGRGTAVLQDTCIRRVPLRELPD